MNLVEFMKRSEPLLEKGLPQREYLREPGWRRLYVRLTWHYIGLVKHRCLDLANIEARTPGRGTFRDLVSNIRVRWPTLTIYVEGVLEQRFADGLLRMGFRRADTGGEKYGSYYLLPEEVADGSTGETR